MYQTDLLKWAVENAEAFALVLIRISTLVFMFPIFSSRAIPMQVKAAMSLVLALMLTPVVSVYIPPFPENTLKFLAVVAAELFLAVSLSLVIRMVFAGLQIAGQMVGIQMGLSVANIIDPQSGAQSVIVAQFAYTFALLLFLVADGHHALLRVLIESFRTLPVGSLSLSPDLLDVMLAAGKQMFVLSVKLMAPVMGILLIAQVALGILAKLVPQINMLMVSLNLNVGLGLFFLGLTMQFFWPVLGRYLHEAVSVMPEMVKMMAGS